MLASNLNNPFAIQKLDDTVSLPPGDVPDLHKPVLDMCQTALRQVTQTRQSAGLLVVGEAGSGKSHLIAQLRKRLEEKPQAVLAAIRMRGAFAGKLWRHLRKSLVTELLRGYANREHGENGLTRLLGNRFPSWSSGSGKMTGLLGVLIGQPNATHALRRALEDASRKDELDYALCKVLPQITSAANNALAQQWLRGEHLADDDLKCLGLPPFDATEQEQEIRARAVVLSILRLAGERTTLIICFDEVEAIQAGSHDAPVLREFTALATDLLAETGARVIATFVRPNLQVDIGKAVEVSHIQKMAQMVARIPALSWEQTVQIVRFRLVAEPTCQAARQHHGDDPDWPLGKVFVQQTFDANRLALTPRHLIRACQVEFERLQKEIAPPAVAVDSEPTTQRSQAVDEFLRYWEHKSKRYLEKIQGLQFDAIMAIGLPWLVEITALPLARVQDTDKRLGDVSLVFHPRATSGRPVGVSFCNHEPRLLWRRLDRLHAQWANTKGALLGSLCILRLETEKTTQASQERLDKLQHAGVRLILIRRQQFTELAAFQSMFTLAHTGELTRSGKPVDLAEYNAWATPNLTSAVKDLLDQVFDRVATAAKPAAKPVSRAKKAAATRK